MSGGQPRAVLLPVADRSDDPARPVWPEDLDIREWFPFGTDRIRLSSFPHNRNHQLRNHYTVFTSKVSPYSASNQCLNPRWGLDVDGNVLVVRHARRNLVRVTNIHSLEHQLIDYLVTTYFASF